MLDKGMYVHIPRPSLMRVVLTIKIYYRKIDYNGEVLYKCRFIADGNRQR